MCATRLAVYACLMLCYATLSGRCERIPGVDVFTMGEGGYYCIKIPYLFTTFQGSLLAFGEGRWGSCSDFTATDLVYKKSVDGGATWSALRVLYSNTSEAKGTYNTIGNAAPVQLRSSGRILVPFCQNNFAVWQTTSDDDGESWSAPEAIHGGTRPGWMWVGTGPPGALQLASGRLIVPSYHSYVNDTDGDLSRVHIMINDDPEGNASSWYIGGVAPGIELTNECQAVELEPNHLLLTTHGVLTQRMQIESFDGGETLNEPYYIDITSPLGGCEGSILKHPTEPNLLLFSGTTNTNPERYNMTLWSSKTNGTSWDFLLSVDTGRTAYSSLVALPDRKRIGLLYERTNLTDFIFVPNKFTFSIVFPVPSK